MMCAATASPAAASSGPGGDGFFPAATISSSPAPGALFMPLPEGSLAAAGLGLGLPAPDSRGHYQLLLSGRALADRYRRIYTAALSDRDQGGSSAGHPASRLPTIPKETTSISLHHPNWQILACYDGEGNGNPLQYSCLQNPMDRGSWWAAIYGVTESDTTEVT